MKLSNMDFVVKCDQLTQYDFLKCTIRWKYLPRNKNHEKTNSGIPRTENIIIKIKTYTRCPIQCLVERESWRTLIKGYLQNFKNYFPIEGIQGEVQREE